tara:strand:- start:569 stop:1126 length:558 start_codon:yes stop_codon:yes gene_type:complete
VKITKRQLVKIIKEELGEGRLVGSGMAKVLTDQLNGLATSLQKFDPASVSGPPAEELRAAYIALQSSMDEIFGDSLENSATTPLEEDGINEAFDMVLAEENINFLVDMIKEEVGEFSNPVDGARILGRAEHSLEGAHGALQNVAAYLKTNGAASEEVNSMVQQLAQMMLHLNDVTQKDIETIERS